MLEAEKNEKTNIVASRTIMIKKPVSTFPEIDI